MKFFLAKDETSPRLECKHPVKIDSNTKQINTLELFALYLDGQNNHYAVESLGKGTFKLILFSSNIKKMKTYQQIPEWNKQFPIIENKDVTDLKQFVTFSRIQSKVYNQQKLWFTRPPE